MIEPGSVEQPSWLQRNRVRVAAITATLVAAVGIQAMVRGSNDESFTTSAPVEATFTDPSPMVLDDNSSLVDFQQALGEDYHFQGGYDAGVIAPTPQMEEAYSHSYMNDEGLPSTDPPRLREAVFINDRKAFSRESKEDPNAAPFIVFNATNYPVDEPFTRYSAIAIRVWQENHEQDPIRLNNAIQARTWPIVKPHIMIQTQQMPPIVRNKSGFGVTRDYPNLELSWIRPQVHAQHIKPSDIAMRAFKNPAAFASRSTIATEMCQSLVEVYDAKPLIGASYAAGTMEQTVSEFNPPAAYDLDLTAQESVCNGLGRVLAALYVGGLRGVQSVISQTPLFGLEQTPWLDYSLYASQLNTFFQISEGVKQHPSVIETTTGHSTPTARYYWSKLE